MEVETIVAVSLMMAVFSAVAAIGSSIVLGAGFERLRTGFEVIRKQTGFFSDAIHKLEQKVTEVDRQTGQFTHSIQTLEAKVTNVADQANIFSETIQTFEKKVDIVDKQAGFFSNALHKLEKQIETASKHEEIVAEKLQRHAETELISTDKADALVSHAENLLTQMSLIASRIQSSQPAEKQQAVALQPEIWRLEIPGNLGQFCVADYNSKDKEIRYH